MLIWRETKADGDHIAAELDKHLIQFVQSVNPFIMMCNHKIGTFTYADYLRLYKLRLLGSILTVNKTCLPRLRAVVKELYHPQLEQYRCFDNDGECF